MAPRYGGVSGRAGNENFGGLLGCIPTLGSCRKNEDCCSNRCSRFGLCHNRQGGSLGCIPTLGSCRKNEDCCSNRCSRFGLCHNRQGAGNGEEVMEGGYGSGLEGGNHGMGGGYGS